MTYCCLILSDKFKTAYGMTHTPKGEFYMDENRTYLKVWANGKHLELLQLAVQMFNEESTDFDVEISVEEKTGSEIKEELSTCLREEKYEDMPDIVLVDDAQMKFYLENYCEYFHCFEDLNTDDFNIFNNHNYFAENGWEKYAIPHSCNPFALYYNVDILEDCGIDVAELTDWESFREAGQKLKEDGYYLLPALDWYAITAFMYSAGIDLNFESEDRHESFCKLLNFLLSLQQEGFIYPEIKQDYSQKFFDFATKKFAAFVGAPYDYDALLYHSDTLGDTRVVAAGLPKENPDFLDVSLYNAYWMAPKTGSEERENLAATFLQSMFTVSGGAGMQSDMALEAAENKLVPVLKREDNALSDYYIIGDFYELSKKIVRPYISEQETEFLNGLEYMTKRVLYEALEVEIAVDILLDEEIPVPPKTPGNIKIVSPPSKTTYFVGEKFDKTGMEVEVEFTDGTIETVSAYNVNPVIMSLGTSYVTVSYISNFVEVNTQQSVTVTEAAVERIEVSGDYQEVYLEGDKFSPSGLSVKAFYENGSSKTVSGFDYEPKTSLGVSDTEITVTYTENGKTVSQAVSIDVAKKDVKGLRIAEFPDTTVYKKGMSFDPAGMVVEAHYDNKIWRQFDGYSLGTTDFSNPGIQYVTVTFGIYYTLFPVRVKDDLTGFNIDPTSVKRNYVEGEQFDSEGLKGTAFHADGYSETVLSGFSVESKALTAADRYVTVSYSEYGITKSARLPVYVMSVGKDMSKGGQAELKYSCGAGEASVNLFTDRIRLERHDMNAGANSYAFGLSHIYNSCFDESLSLKQGSGYYKTHMGKGFKLDVQQYLFEGKNDSYEYLDGAGYWHTFLPLGDGERYYDTDGLNLTLKQTAENEFAITDEQGNKLVFESGRLCKTISCHNSNVENIFDYNQAGQLAEIYDNRNKSLKICLEYDEGSGLLKAMRCVKNGATKREIFYAYDSLGRLISTTENGERSVFSYGADGKISGMAFEPDKSAVLFENGSAGSLTVKCGAADISVGGDAEGFALSLTQQNTFSCNCISGGSGTRAFTTVRNRKGATESDEKDVVMKYYFNTAGYTTGIFEVGDYGAENLKSLEKLSGVSLDLPETDTAKTVFNRRNSYFCDLAEASDSAGEVQLSGVDKLVDYKKYKCANYKYFNATFFLKLHTTLENPSVKVVLFDNNKEKACGEVFADATALGGWQFLTVPLELSDNSFDDVRVQVGDANATANFEIADVRIVYSPLSRCFVKAENESAWAPMDSVKKLSYKKAGSSTFVLQEISDDCYMSDKDMQNTFLSMYKERATGQKFVHAGSFALSLCDGRRRLWVSDARLWGKDIKDETDEYKWFDLKIEKLADNSFGTAMFNHETRSPDDMMATHGYMRFYPDLSVAGLIGEGVGQYTTAEKDGSSGSKTETYVYADLKGKKLCEIDEYGVVVSYAYDAFGMLSKKTISHPDTNETIEYSAVHDEVSSVETTATSKNGVNYDTGMDRTEKTIYGGKNETDGGLTKTYSYDATKNRLTGVSYAEENGENLIEYDQAGRISAVTPTGFSSYGYGYGAEYNNFGDATKFYLIKTGEGEDRERTLLVSKEADYAQGTVTTKTYRNQNTAEQHKLTLDKYGRTEKIEENGKTTTFIRQVLPESAGASEVTFMCDPFENRTYKYFYDDFNNCTGVEIEQSNETVFTMKKTGTDEVQYDFLDFTQQKTGVTYDKDKVLAPRIKESVDFKAERMSGRFNRGVTEYTYDSLGRLQSKRHKKEESGTGEIFDSIITVQNRYQKGTALKTQIYAKHNYVNLFQTEYEIKHTYDSRGLFLSDTYKTTHDGETSTKVRSYTYDKSNRLKTETANGYTLEYAYNKDGTLCSETGGGVVKAYSYENGRVTSYIRSGDLVHTKFEYDNYGNCIQYCKTPFSSTEIEWERGNLLKKIRNTEYEYNSSGLRFRKKTGSETTEYYYDGTKLLGENRNGEKEIRYIYDAEGIAGFEISSEANPYMFVKDARNNVVAILDNGGEVAAYEYDAWGSCKVVKDTDGIGTLNPIRWKSQYYDSDSAFYYINNRFYSAATKQFLDGGSPETALANATTIYGLNPHNSTLTNPLSEAYNEYTIETATELAFDPPELTKWQSYWRSGWGKGLATALFVMATIATIAAAIAFPISAPEIWAEYAIFFGLSAVTFGIAGLLAGYQSSQQGYGFWNGFVNYIRNNWAQEVAITSAIYIVTLGLNTLRYSVANVSVASPETSESLLNPQEIHYTQNSISNKFSGAYKGQCVDDLIDGLISGKISPMDIPAIQVFEYQGKIYSINNRRLFAFKTANIPYVKVEWVNMSIMQHAWTGNGIDIIVRGGSKYL